MALGSTKKINPHFMHPHSLCFFICNELRPFKVVEDSKLKWYIIIAEK